MNELSRQFDRMNDLISTGQAAQTSILLMGYLGAMRDRSDVWPTAVSALRSHPLHKQLLDDPFNRRCFEKPRGYAGDAKMIDLIYHREAPEGTSGIGHDLFSVTLDFQTAEAVRLRRELAEAELQRAHRAGKRILSLACGHFREGGPLAGQNLENITLVDQDPLSLAVVRKDHGDRVQIVEANVIRFLRQASLCGQTWDYIYTLGLTDYFDDQVMRLFHLLLAKVLAPQGEILLANFVPDHLSVGWMEAVMDWHLVYRSEADLARLARAAGFAPRTWLDDTGCIAYCRMTHRMGSGA